MKTKELQPPCVRKASCQSLESMAFQKKKLLTWSSACRIPLLGLLTQTNVIQECLGSLSFHQGRPPSASGLGITVINKSVSQLWKSHISKVWSDMNTKFTFLLWLVKGQLSAVCLGLKMKAVGFFFTLWSTQAAAWLWLWRKRAPRRSHPGLGEWAASLGWLVDALTASGIICSAVWWGEECHNILQCWLGLMSLLNVLRAFQVQSCYLAEM